jgi:hypothetical protein
MEVYAKTVDAWRKKHRIFNLGIKKISIRLE